MVSDKLRIPETVTDNNALAFKRPSCRGLGAHPEQAACSRAIPNCVLTRVVLQSDSQWLVVDCHSLLVLRPER